MSKKWTDGAASVLREKTDGDGVQAVAAPGTSEALVASETMVRALWMFAKRVGGANAGVVFLKQGTGSSDLRADHTVALNPGDYWEKLIPQGTMYDLANLWIDAEVATDGVLFGYVPI